MKPFERATSPRQSTSHRLIRPESIRIWSCTGLVGRSQARAADHSGHEGDSTWRMIMLPGLSGSQGLTRTREAQFELDKTDATLRLLAGLAQSRSCSLRYLLGPQLATWSK